MEKHVIDFSVAYQLPAKVNSFATLSPLRPDAVLPHHLSHTLH